MRPQSINPQPTPTPASCGRFRAAALLFCLTCCLACCLPATAQTWYAGPDWRPQASPLSRQILLTGLWPNTCTPVLERAWQEQGELRVHTVPEGSGCQQTPTPFEMSLAIREAELEADRISWWHAPTDSSAYQMHGFRLLSKRGETPGAILRPDSGWWWPEPGGEFEAGGPGSGLTVDYQGGFITLVTQAYDDNGRPEWLVASGSLRQGRISAPLVRFQGGSTLTGPYQAPDVTPTPWSISLQFHSAATATAWYTRRLGGSLADPIELRAVSLVRYLMDPPVLQRLLLGHWLLAPQSRQVLDAEANSVMQLNIAAIEVQDEQTLLLLDTEGHSLGHCELDRQRSESPPRLCRLLMPATKGQPDSSESAIHIDDFGFDRMSGRTAAGEAVTLFRLP